MIKCSNKLFSHTESQDSFPWEIHSDLFDNFVTKLAPFIAINVLHSRPLYIQAWRRIMKLFLANRLLPADLPAWRASLQLYLPWAKEKHNQGIKNVIKVPSEARFKSFKRHYSFPPAHVEVCWKVPIMVPPSVVIPFSDAGKVPTKIISYLWSFCSILRKNEGIFLLIKYLFSCFTMQKTSLSLISLV